jgi:hypothetical protein
LRLRLAALATALLGLALAGCAPKLHTVEPYRSDRSVAAALEARASTTCEQGPEGPRSAPEKRFVTDGCSSWLDDGWAEPCCVDHDIHYWCGGSAQERRAADTALRRCIRERQPSWLAGLMWLGVRLGGHPIFPTHYRWGYGRVWQACYGDEAEP